MNLLNLNLDGGVVQRSNIGFGVDQYTYFYPGYLAPAGVFWCASVHAGGLTRSEIYDTWVIEQLRRKGIARQLLAAVRERSDVITTVGVKSDAGLAFVEATGFVYDRSLAAWVLKCPRYPVDVPAVNEEKKSRRKAARK